MRKSLAVLVCLSLTFGAIGDSRAQTDASPLNEGRKSSGVRAPAAAAEARVAPDLQELAKKAAALVDAGDEELPEARRLLGNLRADARFEEQPVTFRVAVLGVAGYAEMNSGEGAAAIALFQQAIALRDADSDLWYWLSWVQAGQEQYDDAAHSLATLLTRWPKVIDRIDDDLIWRLSVQKLASEAARTEVLQAIFDSGWKRELRGGADHFHYQLALIRAKQGDLPALRKIVARIEAPNELVQMLTDQRFDAVLDRDSVALDVRAGAERRVKSLQAQVRAAPQRLETLVELQAALMAVGRFSEVITLAEDVSSAIAVAAKDTPAYLDMDKLMWVQNQHAMALEALGKSEAAVSVLEAASRLKEQGQDNVSQLLNLANLLTILGRPDEALAATARVGTNLSAFGLMVKASIEHAAYLQKGDDANAAKTLEYLRENRTASETIYLDALVESGDLDAAAANLIAQLASPDDRADALYETQEFMRTPDRPGNKASRANWQNVRNRPDVRAAVQKVGRSLKFNLFRPG